MADNLEVRKVETEVTAIKAVVEAVSAMEKDSQRRVLGYVASLLGVNEADRQAFPRAPMNPGNVRTIPLPAGVNPQAVAESLRSAGVSAQARG
jgi:hypothetical protein